VVAVVAAAVAAAARAAARVAPAGTEGVARCCPRSV
jgi:hypothetical protein